MLFVARVVADFENYRIGNKLKIINTRTVGIAI